MVEVVPNPQHDARLMHEDAASQTLGHVTV